MPEHSFNISKQVLREKRDRRDFDISLTSRYRVARVKRDFERFLSQFLIEQRDRRDFELFF